MVKINVNLTKVRDHRGHPVVKYKHQNLTAPIFCPGNSSAKGGNDAGGGVGAPTGYNPYQMQMQEAPPPQVQMEVAPAALPPAATGPVVPPPDPGSKLPVYGEAAAPLPYSVNPTAAAPAPAAAAPYPPVGGRGGYQQQPGVNPGYEPPPPYPTA